MQSLVGDLFELSRIDAGTLALDTETVSLTDLASDVVAEYGELARANGVALAFSAADAVTVPVDARQFSRALVNVLINAIEHSPEGGTVTVSIDTEGALAKVTTVRAAIDAGELIVPSPVSACGRATLSLKGRGARWPMRVRAMR